MPRVVCVDDAAVDLAASVERLRLPTSVLPDGRFDGGFAVWLDEDAAASAAAAARIMAMSRWRSRTWASRLWRWSFWWEAMVAVPLLENSGRGGMWNREN